MGIFDFFRTKPKIEDKRTIQVDGIEKWLDERRKESKDKINRFLSLIKERMKILIRDLDGEIDTLENVDVTKRKDYEKIKEMASKNLENYIFLLRNFKERMEELTDYNELDLLNKVNVYYNDFKKKSVVSLDRATFLVGKEIEQVKMSLSNFTKSLRIIEDENSESLKEYANLDEIYKDYLNFVKIKELELQIDKEIKENEKAIEENKQKIEFLRKKIDIIEKSTEYIEEKKEGEEREGKIEQMRRDIKRFKSLINFKDLQRIFHINEKKMTSVKEHMSNFNEGFEKDNGNMIVGLLEEGNLMNDEMKELIDNIEKQRGEISKLKVKGDSTLLLRKEIENIEGKINLLIMDRDKLNKRKEKGEINKKEVLEKIKVNLIKLDVVFDAN